MKISILQTLAIGLVLVAVPAAISAAPAVTPAPPAAQPAPAVLPGKGLAGHEFFYAGEAKDRQVTRTEIHTAIPIGTDHVLELTPDKKVVWALRAWADPNLGLATTIQILDTPTAPEKVHFGDIK